MNSPDNYPSISKNPQHELLPAHTVVTRNLTIQEIKESSISANHKEVLLARYGECRVKDLDANYAGERLKQVINLTIFESGYKVENISETIIMVIRDIFSDFSYMTISDISLAFRKGVRGMLGEFMGLSIKTFYTWLKSYNEEVITEANKQLLKIEKPQELTEAEKEKIHRDWLIRHIADFEQFKNNLECKEVDFGNIFYDYLVGNSIESLTSEEKNFLMEQARQNLISSMSIEKARNMQDAKKFKLIVESLLNNEKSEEARVISEAKKLAIPIIYVKLIDKEKDLKTIIYNLEGWEV